VGIFKTHCGKVLWAFRRWGLVGGLQVIREVLAKGIVELHLTLPLCFLAHESSLLHHTNMPRYADLSRSPNQ
jgi:hypothetical protein